MAYAIRALFGLPPVQEVSFPSCKTMYGGRWIGAGDRIFLFSGKHGLIGQGVVAEAEAIDRVPGVARQTPCVRLAIRGIVPPHAPLGRAALIACSTWGDGRPETEINFKLYRQATDKVAGIADATAEFLGQFFLDRAEPAG